jgi:amino acid transporter
MKKIINIIIIMLVTLIGVMFVYIGWQHASTATDKAVIAQDVVVILLGSIWIMVFFIFLIDACFRQNHHSKRNIGKTIS